jgi:hypothetical protein
MGVLWVFIITVINGSSFKLVSVICSSENALISIQETGLLILYNQSHIYFRQMWFFCPKTRWCLCA